MCSVTSLGIGDVELCRIKLLRPNLSNHLEPM